VRAIDSARLTKYVGTLSQEQLAELDAALRLHLAL
jgi:mRNA-degrading endonuclease toxin of MazEF toxin-antitoxin module